MLRTLLVLLAATAAAPALAEASFSSSRHGGPVSASASLAIRVVIPPVTVIRQGPNGPQVFTNVKGARPDAWDCTMTVIEGEDPPARTFAGRACEVRTVSQAQALEHGVFRGWTYASP